MIGIDYFPIFSGLRRILKSLIMGLAAGVLPMGEYIGFFLPSSDSYPWEEYFECCWESRLSIFYSCSLPSLNLHRNLDQQLLILSNCFPLSSLKKYLFLFRAHPSPLRSKVLNQSVEYIFLKPLRLQQILCIRLAASMELEFSLYF